MEVWVASAAVDLGESVAFEWVNSTKTAQTVWVLGNLFAHPVIFGFYLGVLLGARRLIGISVAVCHRQNHRSAYMCFVEHLYKIRCDEATGRLFGGHEKVLVIVNQRLGGTNLRESEQC